MFDVEFMTYARVAADATAHELQLRPITEGVASFLSDHIAALRELTEKRRSPLGVLRDQEARALFRDLREAPAHGFTVAAENLTKRLVSQMDGRTTPGLFVCLRARSDSELVAGALKLEIVAEHAAMLERLDSGEEVLAAATNMMDKPGDLKKGALTSSDFSDDQVSVGDRLTYTSAYFPVALGIQIYSTPVEGTKELIGVLHAVAPAAVPVVARKLPELHAATIREVLDELGREIPEITAPVRDEVNKRIESLPRPILEIDRAAKVKVVVKAGQITVSGPVEAMHDALTITELSDKRWQIEILAADEPATSFR